MHTRPKIALYTTLMSESFEPTKHQRPKMDDATKALRLAQMKAGRERAAAEKRARAAKTAEAKANVIDINTAQPVTPEQHQKLVSTQDVPSILNQAETHPNLVAEAAAQAEPVFNDTSLPSPADFADTAQEVANLDEGSLADRFKEVEENKPDKPSAHEKAAKHEHVKKASHAAFNAEKRAARLAEKAERAAKAEAAKATAFLQETQNATADNASDDDLDVGLHAIPDNRITDVPPSPVEMRKEERGWVPGGVFMEWLRKLVGHERP